MIKLADKGSAVVVMNMSDYIEVALRQLGDIKFYEKTTCNLTELHIREITKVVTEMYKSDEIDEKCKNYHCHFRTKNFKALLVTENS